MATTVSVRPPSATPKMKRPIPPSIQTSVNGAATTMSSSPPPASATNNRGTSASQSSPTMSGTGLSGPTAKPSIRQRRELQRPSLTKSVSRGGAGEGVDARLPGRQKLNEPFVRTSSYILKKFNGSKPSLVVHLHPTHFRFDQQDGSFGYNSPMKVFLEHIKAQTVPHEMLEELLKSQVPFYNGCLIVEVHDHKSGPTATQNVPPETVGAGKHTPSSIHNYNPALTPSPYIPYPLHETQSKAKAANSSSKDTSASTNGDVATQKSVTAQGKAPRKERVFTTVLHPTTLSRHIEMSILGRQPMVEPRKRQSAQANRDGNAPSSGQPPTPLSAIPPTPTTSRSSQGRPQRMCLEENDYHQFEADVLRATEAPLLLDIPDSFQDAVAIMKHLTHPLHTQAPPQPRGRKRTFAELAANEAQAAEEERIALLMDERLKPSLSSGNNNAAGAESAAQDFQPNFARFKALEDIRRAHDEKKLEEERMNQLKKEQTHQKQREEMEARKEQEQRQHMIQMRQQQQQAHHNAQSQLAQQAQAQAQAKAQAQAQATLMNQQSGNQAHQQMMQNLMRQQSSHAQHSSPMVRNSTPALSSPSAPNGAMMQGPGIAMSQSMSNQQGPGSPPRPGSAIHVPQNIGNAPMNRQTSQQTSQHDPSRNGTPQVPHMTPQMSNGAPTRHMTPQPHVSQGSPQPGVMQGTPMMNMMSTPQMGHQQMNMNPQQQAALLQRQRAHMQSAQGPMSNSPTSMSNQMSPQQQAAMQSQQQAQRQQMSGQMTAQQQAVRANMPNASTPQQAQQEEYRRAMAAKVQAQGQALNQNQVSQGQPLQSSPQPNTNAGGFPSNMAMAHAMSGGQNMPQLQQQLQQQQNLNMQQQLNAQRQQQQQSGNQGQNAQVMTQQQQQQRRQQLFAQQVHDQQQQRFFRDLMAQNGNQLPADAQQRWSLHWRKMLQRQQASQQAQQQMAAMQQQQQQQQQQNANNMQGGMFGNLTQQQQQQQQAQRQQQMNQRLAQQQASQAAGMQMGNASGLMLDPSSMSQQNQQQQSQQQHLAALQKRQQLLFHQQRLQQMQQQQANSMQGSPIAGAGQQPGAGGGGGMMNGVNMGQQGN